MGHCSCLALQEVQGLLIELLDLFVDRRMRAPFKDQQLGICEYQSITTAARAAANRRFPRTAKRFRTDLGSGDSSRHDRTCFGEETCARVRSRSGAGETGEDARPPLLLGCIVLVSPLFGETARESARLSHHTRQAFTGIIGCPGLQPKARPNSGRFCTTPFARNCRGE